LRPSAPPANKARRAPEAGAGAVGKLLLTKAFSSEVETGSREENATKVIQSFAF